MLGVDSLKLIPSIVALGTLTTLVVYYSGGDGAGTSGETDLGGSGTAHARMRALAPSAELTGEESASQRFKRLVYDDPDPIISSGISRERQERVSSQRKAKEALRILSEAARNGDKAVLDEFGKIGPDCTWCSDFVDYSKVTLADRELRSDERAYIAHALARSGSSAALSQVAGLMADAASHPEKGIDPNAYVDALEEADLTPEVVDQLSANLDSDNPYLREAAVSVLTKQGTLEAIRQLYEHTVKVENPDGYYREGMGIGVINPHPEAISYLEGLVTDQNEYSHLAVKALINSGEDGLNRAIAIINGIQDYKLSKSLLKGANDRVGLDSASIAQMQKLKSSSPNRAVREFADLVLREHHAGVLEHQKTIEYNENFEEGIILGGGSNRP